MVILIVLSVAFHTAHSIINAQVSCVFLLCAVLFRVGYCIRNFPFE